MPTYNYLCDNCKHDWEVEQRIVDAPLEECPKCQEKRAKRQIGVASFILKGEGWASDSYSK